MKDLSARPTIDSEIITIAIDCGYCETHHFIPGKEPSDAPRICSDQAFKACIPFEAPEGFTWGSSPGSHNCYALFAPGKHEGNVEIVSEAIFDIEQLRAKFRTRTRSN